ncbi:hypothetical protein BC629DRAFT_879358 [Irpex lacteus]|nr:hypothetical protein BC629DRAFT_879358 [Irpex lacteus]
MATASFIRSDRHYFVQWSVSYQINEHIFASERNGTFHSPRRRTLRMSKSSLCLCFALTNTSESDVSLSKSICHNNCSCASSQYSAPIATGTEHSCYLQLVLEILYCASQLLATYSGTSTASQHRIITQNQHTYRTNPSTSDSSSDSSCHDLRPKSTVLEFLISVSLASPANHQAPAPSLSLHATRTQLTSPQAR